MDISSFASKRNVFAYNETGLFFSTSSIIFGENNFNVSYEATTDQETIVNLTQHAYFNLSGNLSTNIYNHELQIKGDFVAEVDERIVGFALYYIRYSTWKGQAMYLEDILITNEMRGKGIGKLLFDRLVEEARDKKFNRIIWQVLDWNEPAINFYKKYNADFDAGWLNCSIYV